MYNSSARKSARRTLVPTRKPRSLKDRFFLCLGLNFVIALILGCLFFVHGLSDVSVKHDGSVAKDCFNNSTGQIYTVPAKSSC